MKKICIFTSTRADYGILYPLINRLSLDSTFQVRLFVTGTHLMAEHGETLNEIIADGFSAYYKVDLDATTATLTQAEVMGLAQVNFAKQLKNEVPDLSIVLGDRFEALAFALACSNLGIPVCHLHGGEVTTGALDDVFRHAITKISYLHFTANEKYRKRVICMGENPANVFNVGALAIDNIKATKLWSRKELESDLKFTFNDNTFLVTYHPETMSPEIDKVQIDSLVLALTESIQKYDAKLIITKSNIDQGGEYIDRKITELVKQFPDHCKYVSSLGRVRYLSLLKESTLVIGNSSSGIIEAPAVGTPTVNIGKRQFGRDMATSIFSTGSTVKSIGEAIEIAIKYKATSQGKSSSLFGEGHTAELIYEQLRFRTFEMFPKKIFHDVSVNFKEEL